MFDRVHVVGRGRVGEAVAARLADRGRLAAEGAPPDLVLLCVPDAAIGDVARATPAGPWIAHVSGATPLAALEPHVRRFGLHPLQTFRRGGGAGQLDGAYGAVVGESVEARAAGHALAELLGLRAFDLADDQRAIYHAGAVMASNYLVTLYQCAARAVTRAGVPPDALVPLMRRTIENGFDLTGPIARGDWATVEAHLRALEADLPDLLPMYRELARLTAR